MRQGSRPSGRVTSQRTDKPRPSAPAPGDLGEHRGCPNVRLDLRAHRQSRHTKGNESDDDERLKKTGVLKFRIDAETYASLKNYCAQTGQSMSVVLRDILERELARAALEGHETTPPPAEATGAQIRFEQ
jgi:hypothetical protein